MAEIHRQGCQNGHHFATKKCFAMLAVFRAQCLPFQELDPFLRQFASQPVKRMRLLGQHGESQRLQVRQDMHFFLGSVILWSQPFEYLDALHEEFIQVGCEDRKELQSLHEG